MAAGSQDKERDGAHLLAPMRLITIRGSHYCERARWALDLAGLPYVEESSAPLLHMFATRAVRPPGCTSTSTPILITHDPAVGTLTDSRDIVAFAVEHAPRESPAGAGPESEARGLYPSDPELRKQVGEIEALCTKRLNVWARILCYQSLFADREEALSGMCDRVPAWQRRVMWLFYRPIKALMCKGLGVNAENAAICADKIRGVFKQLGETLGDGRRPYLVGDSFTAADLTFASMAALVVLPEQYGGPPPATVDLSCVRRTMDPALLEELRGTAAGQHALAMYRKHRCTAPPLAAAPAAAAAGRAGSAMAGGQAASSAQRRRT